MQGLPVDVWAKLREVDGRVVEHHLLVDHSADVAAVTEALLQESILGRRLARLMGQDELHPVQVARFCVLAALHDVGKANHGFQNRAFGRSPTAGHLSEVVDLIKAIGVGYPEADRFFETLCLEEIGGWTRGPGLLDWLLVVFSHHGRPVREKVFEVGLWQPRHGRDPMDAIARLVERTRSWFPKAWQDGGPGLPDDPQVQHAFAGLLMLADWIGSNSSPDYFPFSEEGEGDRMELGRVRARKAVRSLGLAPAEERAALGTAPVGYGFMPPPFKPHPAQARIVELDDLRGGSVVVLEAATGAGKTEAALAHYFRLFQEGEVDGLYFALPTRTAATQIYDRVCRAVATAFSEPSLRPPVVLAVPGYLSVDGREGQRLEGFQVRWPEEDGSRWHFRGWAAEHSKRYLAGAVVVGTVDQALLSSLTVSHAHLRASALLRHLLVVDEVHASDAYMTRVLEAVLDHHRTAGGHALLMSATLGSEARLRLTQPPGAAARPSRQQGLGPSWEETRELPYPALTIARRAEAAQMLPIADASPQKRVRIEMAPILESPGAIASRALHAARSGARVLVIRNTVGGCREVQEELEAQAGEDRDLLFTCAGKPTCHHARYCREDRKALDRAVEAAFGKNRTTGSLVIVATQTVEQSLDLDADLLLTDLAPLDVLLQRIGRLHRHVRPARPSGFGVATVVLLTPTQRDLGGWIASDGKPRGAHGLGTVYSDLRILEATWARLERETEVELPRQNRTLVEDATHPQALEAVIEAGGAPWRAHERFLIGSKLSDRKMANLNRLDRSLGFQDLSPFPSGDTSRRIPTRLGEEDRRVRFSHPPTSPFGWPVEEMTVPFHLAKGVPAEAELAANLVVTDDGFRFSFGGKPFRYDRLGLHEQGGEGAGSTTPGTENDDV